MIRSSISTSRPKATPDTYIFLQYHVWRQRVCQVMGNPVIVNDPSGSM